MHGNKYFGKIRRVNFVLNEERRTKERLIVSCLAVVSGRGSRWRLGSVSINSEAWIYKEKPRWATTNDLNLSMRKIIVRTGTQQPVGYVTPFPPPNCKLGWKSSKIQVKMLTFSGKICVINRYFCEMITIFVKYSKFKSNSFANLLEKTPEMQSWSFKYVNILWGRVDPQTPFSSET